MSPGWKCVKELKITWIIGLIVFLIINLVLLSSTWMNDGPLLTTSGILYPDFLPDWIYGLPGPCARSTCCGRRCRSATSPSGSTSSTRPLNYFSPVTQKNALFW